MTSTDRLIAILERAESSADQAYDCALNGAREAAAYAEDAGDQIGAALKILRELEAEAERDIQKQAGAWGL